MVLMRGVRSVPLGEVMVTVMEGVVGLRWRLCEI